MWYDLLVEWVSINWMTMGDVMCGTVYDAFMWHSVALCGTVAQCMVTPPISNEVTSASSSSLCDLLLAMYELVLLHLM